MPVEGAELLTKNIAAYGKRFLGEVDRDMEEVRGIMDKAVDESISLKDHTLKDLAALGHPYARRRPQKLHEPEWLVHEQSGKMRAAKFSGVDKAGVSAGKLSASAFVGIRESENYFVFVVFGTTKMIPRDFLNGSVEKERGKIFGKLKRSLNQATIMFRGEARKL
jgi:hypothetical protein